MPELKFSPIPSPSLPPAEPVPEPVSAPVVQLTWQPLSPAKGVAAFAWPTPPLAAYPLPTPLREPEPCAVERSSGELLSGLLLSLDPVQGLVRVQVPPERRPVLLRVSQIRRLTLQRPLAPLTAALVADAQGDAASQLLAHYPSQPYAVQLIGGASLDGRTIAPVETEAGVFLFEPHDAPGSVRRSFVPRAMIERLDLGERLGVLLMEGAATAEQIEQGLQLQQQQRQQKLGERLLARQVVTPAQLFAALDRQARMPRMRLGEALVALGFLNEEQLQDALHEQTGERQQPLGEVLQQSGLVSAEQVRIALARKLGFPVVDVTNFPIEPAALRALPLDEARRLHVLPLMRGGERLVLALADPSQQDTLTAVQALAQCPVAPALVGSGDLAAAIERAYAQLDAAPEAAPEAELEAESAQDNPSRALFPAPLPLAANPPAHPPTANPTSNVSPMQPAARTDSPVLQALTRLVLDAIERGASAVHIEAASADAPLQLRLRLNGRLEPHGQLPAAYRGPLLARIKALSDLEASDTRRPQEGRLAFGRLLPQHRIDLRVQTLPTHGGLEDVVLALPMRLKPLALEKIGLAAPELATYKNLLQRPAGLLLCVGPARSGRTTTLHAALARLNQPERRLWTLEDRIELTQPGLRQMEVNRRLGQNPEQALRSLLHTDADVIMVGDIADAATARLALEAALQGRLVLAGMAARNAGDAVMRLLDQGLPAWDLADALIGVHSQRMLRRLCSGCRMSRSAKDTEVDEWLDGYLHGAVLVDADPERTALRARWIEQYGRDGRLRRYHGSGCERCHHTGLRSRMAVHELMPMSRELRRLIRASAPAWHLQRQAMKDGMRTLRQDAVEKMVAGLTSLDEVRTLLDI